jgi:hypothetical protein
MAFKLHSCAYLKNHPMWDAELITLGYWYGGWFHEKRDNLYKCGKCQRKFVRTQKRPIGCSQDPLPLHG